MQAKRDHHKANTLGQTCQIFIIFSYFLLNASAGSARADEISASAARNNVLEEIIVTAQKRQETLQDSPVSITALSQEMIENRGLTDIEGLTHIAPNVNISKVAGGTAASTVRIRGMSNAELILTSDPKSTVYIDGVLVAKSLGSLMDVIDLERIEVLRGPQGTLFGRNAVGGAISLITKKPAEEWDFSHTLDLGNYSLINNKTMINIPIMQSDDGSNSLAARIVFMKRDSDGWVKNEAGSEFLKQHRRGGHVAMFYRHNDWSIDYSFDASRWRDTEPPAWLELTGDASTGIELVLPTVFAQYLAAQGRSETSFSDFVSKKRTSTVPAEFVADVELDVEGHAVTMEREYSEVNILGDVTAKSITAYREMRNSSIGELDGTPVPHTHFAAPYRQQYQFTQEFQLFGNTWDERLDYVVGLFYFEESGGENSINTTLNAALAPPFDKPFGVIDTVYAFDNEAWALFGQMTIADVLIDSLALTLGLRYTEEKRGFDVKRKSTTLLGVDEPDKDECDPASDKYAPDFCVAFDLKGLAETYSNVSPMINVSYPWSEDMMSYLRIASGYQSGGFNGRAQNIVSAQQSYDEETLLSYELGSKSTWLDNRLTLNGAVFYSKNEDLQVPQFPPGGGATVGTVVVNAGESTLQGAELELLALARSNLTVYLNYAYLEGEYDEYIVGHVDGRPVDSAKGREFRQAPKNTLSAGFECVIGRFSFGELTARMDAYWQDDVFLNDAPAIPELNIASQKARDVNRQDAYALLDARVTLDHVPLFGANNVKVSLWAKNLTDKEYRYGSVDLIEQLGFASVHYGDPRSYGIAFTYRYGKNQDN